MLFGKPEEIPQSKIGLYVAYSNFKISTADKKVDEVTNDDFFEVERVVKEFSTIK